MLATERSEPNAFDDTDRKVLVAAGQFLAQAAFASAASEIEPPPAAPSSRTIRIRYYEADDSVFVEDESLIKGLPGERVAIAG